MDVTHEGGNSTYGDGYTLHIEMGNSIYGDGENFTYG